MRCVLDTNVFVSALLSPGSNARLAVGRAQREGAILLSHAVLEELFEVLNRRRFRPYIDEDEVRLPRSLDTRVGMGRCRGGSDRLPRS